MQSVLFSIQALEPRRLLASITVGDDDIVYSYFGKIYLTNSNVDQTTPIATTSAQVSDPSFTPDRTRIVFTGAVPSNASLNEIFIMGVDGSGETRLTNNGSSIIDRDPHVSPDGTRIVFVSNRDGNDEIYTMNLAGGDVKRLTNDAHIDDEPAYSPDGSKIVFISSRTGNDDVYSMDAATGGNVTRLTNNAAKEADPVYSPEGQRIAFSSTRHGPQEIFVMNAVGELQGAVPQRLTTANSQEQHFKPVFSPDGRKIAYINSSNIGSGLALTQADAPVPIDTFAIARVNAMDWASRPRFSGLAEGVVTLVGTAGKDKIVIGDLDDNDNLPLTLNGKTETFPFAIVQQVQVLCGSGNDSVDGSLTSEPLYIAGDSGDDLLIGGVNDDTLTSGAGRNRLFGGDGNDRLNGSGGRDFLYGDAGNDRIYGNGGNDYILGGGNVDRIWGGEGDDFIAGNGQNDKLFGEAGNDEIYGQDGDDVLSGGPGNDTLSGGKGTDTSADSVGADLVDSVEVVP